jgi:hypothetical protein
MRNITITFDDGSTHVYQNAPDEVTPEQVQDRAQRDFGKSVTAIDGGRKSQPMRGTTGSFRPGATGSWGAPTAMDKFKRGFLQDPIAGIQQLGTESEIAGLVAPEWVKNKRAELQQSEAGYQAARKAAGDTGMDWPRLGGQMVNPVNLGIAAITKTPPGATLLTRAAAGATAGGLMGAASPTYGETTRSNQAMMGMAGGAIAAPLTGGASRVVSPKVDPNVALLRKEGITPTVGRNFGRVAQYVEDKLTSLPIFGDAISYGSKQSLDDLNRAVYNRPLSPIGVKHSGTLGEAGVAEVRKTLSNQYKMALSGLSMKPDQQFSSEVTKLNSAVGEMMPAEQNIWKNMLARLNNRTKSGVIDDKTLKSIYTTLDDVTDKLRRDGSFEKAELADTFADLRVALNDAVKRNNPKRQAMLDKLDEGWANYAILRDAAYQATKRKGSGLITPSDLQNAVARAAQRSSSQAAAKGKITEGDALMQDLSDAALRVLPSNYPDSGTVGRALLGGGVLAGTMDPASATAATLYMLGAAGASVPYLPGARNLASWLLSGRQSPMLKEIASGVRSVPGLLSPVAPAAIYGLQDR